MLKQFLNARRGLSQPKKLARRSRPAGAPRASVMIDALETRILFASLPAGFTETLVADGLSFTTSMTFSPDDKLYIGSQKGNMEVWHDGTKLQEDFFRDVPFAVGSHSERGLLGIAFDFEFDQNSYVYVYYTTTAADGHNRVSRFTANATGDLALPGSEKIIMELDPHSAGNHNGGAIHFGSDGYLYIATGDNAQGANSQSLTNRHGKMLRVDVTSGGDDFPSDPGQNYEIPADNPTSFGGVTGTTTGVNRSIFAIGLRNPFTFAFDRSGSYGFINDVGQNTWEEINEIGKGLNYGWPSTEGNFNQTAYPGFKAPRFAYDHGGAEPNGIAITGGAFYNPDFPRYPSQYRGDYFFADYGSSEIWVLNYNTWQPEKFATDANAPIDFDVDSDGYLYYLAHSGGRVFRIEYNAEAPSITDQPDSRTVTVGSATTFAVTASGAAPLTYQWQRAEPGSSTFNNITGATARTFTINSVQSSDNNDRFRVVVRDTNGRTTTSNAATLTTTANRAPTAGVNISAGLRNGKFDAGKAISFSGTAIDAEDGTLAASRYTWQVDYLTTTNGGDADGDGLPGITRPFVQPFSGTKTGAFTPATTGPYTLADVAYVVTLRVTDSGGLTDVERFVINPNVVNLRLQTFPVGLSVTTDGQPFNGTHTFPSVVGFRRPIGVNGNTQSQGGVNYTYASWSDGGTATHTITTPSTGTTYTAQFAPPAGAPFNVKINFQDTTSQGYFGYRGDLGRAYGSRGGGFSYGWNKDNSANGRNRNQVSDERMDTLNHLQKSGGANKWELAVPNGVYRVSITAGDVLATDSIHTLNLEGTTLRDPDGRDNFDFYTANVTVRDGRLTITPGSGAVNAKLAFIEVSAMSNFSAKVNFQAATSGGYTGYLADVGLGYSLQANGYQYGWHGDNTDGMRNRNLAGAPDERYDTLAHFNRINSDNFWLMKVPNGAYRVRIVAGDPAAYDSVYRINVSGVLAINATPSSSKRWFENTVDVNVTNGDIWVTSAAGAVNNKIAFIEITAVL